MLAVSIVKCSKVSLKDCKKECFTEHALMCSEQAMSMESMYMCVYQRRQCYERCKLIAEKKHLKEKIKKLKAKLGHAVGDHGIRNVSADIT